MTAASDGQDPATAAASPDHGNSGRPEAENAAPPAIGSRYRALGVEDLDRAAVAAADLDDPAVMDNAWR